ncbi:MAG: hypothetical protein DRQ88_08260 [Epsilonproteobacteria bacterium]|nr:MAG: hypothetical protein DRQ89_08995 [Campylobacterota bacterium]RLA65981.1 MAG: hypothetical protein DRQ88_08260 [Campylobacterota bacterium]
MFKAALAIFILTLLSCGSDNGSVSSSPQPDAWQSDVVVFDYKKDLIPAQSGEEIKESIFELPGTIANDEVAKISFVFNAKHFNYFKLLRIGPRCQRGALKVSTRLMNLKNNTELKANEELEQNTDYAVEVLASSSSCQGMEISISSWLGNSANSKQVRNCEAAIGNGQIKFKHTLNTSPLLIKLGEYSANFFDHGTFCGEKIKMKGNICKNNTPYFAWECSIVGMSGNKYQFTLNYSNGLKTGSYACKKNGTYIQMASLSSCFDVVQD